MTLSPPTVEIDLMLAELIALCYRRAIGRVEAVEVDKYRRKIVEKVESLTQRTPIVAQNKEK